MRSGRRALVDRLLPQLSLNLSDREEASTHPADFFDDTYRDYWLEVGFGGGEHLLAQAEAHPDIGFIGCEPFDEGVGKLLAGVERAGLRNVRIHAGDARHVMAVLADGSLGRMFLLFPDPWPKKRHHKRRFVNPANIALAARLLRSGAIWRMATDIDDYASWMLQRMCAAEAFEWTARTAADWRHRSEDWPATRYEQKALEQGRHATYLSFRRR